MRPIDTVDLERLPWRLDDADPLAALLSIQQGVISRRQALQHMSLAALRWRLTSERWRQPHRGVFVTHTGPVGSAQQLWIASLSAGEGAVLGGRSALAVLGMNGFAAKRIDVLVPPARHPRTPPDGVVLHRSRVLPDEDIRLTARPVCTTAARSVVDAAAWAVTDNEARTVIAMAFQQRMVTFAAVSTVLGRLVRVRRRPLIVASVADAAGGSHALGELDAVRLLRAAGLPEPTRQQVRVDASGRRRYLDLYFEEYKLHLEIDGSHHLDPRQAWLDADRHNQLYLVGERLLRFPVWLVRERPQTFLAQVRTALIAGGWQP